MENYEYIFGIIVGNILEIDENLRKKGTFTIKAEDFPIIKDEEAQGKTFETLFGATIKPEGDKATVTFDPMAIVTIDKKKFDDYGVEISFDTLGENCSILCPSGITNLKKFTAASWFLKMRKAAFLAENQNVIPLKDQKIYCICKLPFFYTSGNDMGYALRTLKVRHIISMHFIVGGQETSVFIGSKSSLGSACSNFQIQQAVNKIPLTEDVIESQKTSLLEDAKKAWLAHIGWSDGLKKANMADIDIHSLPDNEAKEILISYMKNIVESLQRVSDKYKNEIVLETAKRLAPSKKFDNVFAAANFLRTEFTESDYTAFDGTFYPIFADKHLLTICYAVQDSIPCTEYGGPAIIMPLQTDKYVVNRMMTLIFQAYLHKEGIYDCPLRFCTAPILNEEKVIPF